MSFQLPRPDESPSATIAVPRRAGSGRRFTSPAGGSSLSALPPDILRDVFGYDAFRGHQAEVVSHLIAGGDALVLMPTGGGKSLCYQIPAIARHRAGC
ncbi:MAG: DEAD/DEAH box helicase, partial [Pseudomonadota bacterium]